MHPQHKNCNTELKRKPYNIVHLRAIFVMGKAFNVPLFLRSFKVIDTMKYSYKRKLYPYSRKYV